jgi:prepilin-type processing-associated H-X9-DG protein
MDEMTVDLTSVRGPFQMGAGVRFEDFGDGLSQTFLVGEKHVPITKNGVGWWDCSTYNGRYFMCSSRSAGRLFPLTTDGQDPNWRFGSRHMAVVQFVFADGHVKAVPVSTNPYVLELLSMLNDGEVIPEY